MSDLELFARLARERTGEIKKEEEEVTQEQKALHGVTPLPPVPSEPLVPRLDVNRVRAGFICTCLGDALGVPHEFLRMGKKQYTGVLEHRLKLIRRFQPTVLFGVGQVSDDSEMMITLSRTLIANSRYDWKSVVKAYIKWANSGMVAMGTNTRDLFKVNATTKKDPGGVQHYEKKYIGKFGVYPAYPWETTTKEAEAAQSNGALMRCFPLACLWQTEGTDHDVWLSNPSHVSLECERIYIQALRLAMMGKLAPEIWEAVKDLAKLDDVKRVFSDITGGVARTLADEGKGKTAKKLKGWVCHALYAAMSCLYALCSETPPSFGELMDWVIGGHPGSDTDTIGAISGGLIGAIIGWDELIKNAVSMDELKGLKQDAVSAQIRDATIFVHNVVILLSAGKTNTDLPRPAEYRLEDAENIVQDLWQLSAYH